VVLATAALVLAVGTGLAVWLIAARSGGQELAEFEERSLAYVSAFADAAAAWIAVGNREMLTAAANFMLLGSALFVQVSWDGELLADERLPGIPPPEPPSDTDRETVRLLDLPSGDKYLDIVLPLPLKEGPRGLMHIGLDASWLGSAVRGRILLAAGVGVGIDLLILVALLLVLRRLRPAKAGEGTQPSVELGGLRIYDDGKLVTLYEEPVRLSPKQFTLLRLLASSPGKVFSDREILRAVWPDSRFANSKDVKQYVYLLRQRLGKVRPGAEGMIVTVPGFGYKLIPPDEAGLTER
jgi:DNA-binding winged helix-turn-helix (wHTH) protein